MAQDSVSHSNQSSNVVSVIRWIHHIFRVDNLLAICLHRTRAYPVVEIEISPFSIYSKQELVNHKLLLPFLVRDPHSLHAGHDVHYVCTQHQIAGSDVILRVK